MDYLTKLKELLTKEDYDKVTKDLGDKRLIINDGNYIPIDKFNAKIEEVKNLNEQVESLKTNISDTEKKLNEFSGLADTNETLKTQLTELKELNSKVVTDSELKVKTANEENQQKLNEYIIDSAVKVVMLKYGAVSEASQKSVKANLDFEKITINEKGETVGIDDQLKVMHESTPNLFFGENKAVVGTKYNKGNDTGSLGSSTEDKLLSLYGEN